MDGMGVTGMSPLAMMSMHEQYPWMKEKKSSRKQMGQGNFISKECVKEWNCRVCPQF